MTITIELDVDGKKEEIEMEEKAKAAFEKMAEERGMTFDSLVEALVRAAAVEVEKENG